MFKRTLHINLYLYFFIIRRCFMSIRRGVAVKCVLFTMCDELLPELRASRMMEADLHRRLEGFWVRLQQTIRQPIKLRTCMSNGIPVAFAVLWMLTPSSDSDTQHRSPVHPYENSGFALFITAHQQNQHCVHPHRCTWLRGISVNNTSWLSVLSVKTKQET